MSYTSKDSALSLERLKELEERWQRISDMAYDRWLASPDPHDENTIRHGLVFRMAGHHAHHYRTKIKEITDKE